MSRAILYFKNRELSRGMVGWVATWEEKRRKQQAARRGLAHMLNRGLSKGWNGWMDLVAERDAALQQMRRAVLFMVHRNLSSGFAAWLYVLGMQNDHSVFSRAHAWYRRHTLSDSWGRWAERLLIFAAERALNHRAQGFKRRQQRSSAFGRWLLRAQRQIAAIAQRNAIATSNATHTETHRLDNTSSDTRLHHQRYHDHKPPSIQHNK